MHYEYQNDDDDYDDDFAGSAISSPRTAIYYAVHIACGKCHKTVECPSVHQSVCLSHRWTAASMAGGFAAEVGRGHAAYTE